MGNRIPRRTISIDQAVEMVGVSRRTIYHWIDRNKLQFVRTASGRIRIFEDTLFQSGNVALPAEGVAGAKTEGR